MLLAWLTRKSRPLQLFYHRITQQQHALGRNYMRREQKEMWEDNRNPLATGHSNYLVSLLDRRKKEKLGKDPKDLDNIIKNTMLTYNRKQMNHLFCCPRDSHKNWSSIWPQRKPWYIPKIPFRKTNSTVFMLPPTTQWMTETYIYDLTHTGLLPGDKSTQTGLKAYT